MAVQRQRSRCRTVATRSAVILCISSAATSLVVAQDLLPEKSVGVRDRPRPEYDPLGIRVGLLHLSPKLTIGESYDDNVFATESNEANDLITKVASDVSLQSRGRIPWSLSGGISSGTYAEYSHENYVDWRGGLALAQAFGARTQTVLSASMARNHESPGDPAFPASVIERPDFTTKRAELELSRELGFGRLKFSANIESSDYNDARTVDGAELDQDFRDRNVWELNLRNDFSVGPNTALFIRLLHRQQQYDKTDEVSGVDRDAATDAIYGGAAIWISNLVRGEVGVGVQEVDNADPSQADSRSLAFDGNLEFYLTQLLTATLQAQRSSGAADIAGSSSYVATVIGVKLDYELRRNVILAASFSHSERDYSGLDSNDTSSLSAVSAQWLLNRHARLNFTFSMVDRDYALRTTGRSFTQDVFSADLSFVW